MATPEAPAANIGVMAFNPIRMVGLLSTFMSLALPGWPSLESITSLLTPNCSSG
jgi:hypothetical protein